MNLGFNNGRKNFNVRRTTLRVVDENEIIPVSERKQEARLNTKLKDETRAAYILSPWGINTTG
jgi:hypothetical protein